MAKQPDLSQSCDAPDVLWSGTLSYLVIGNELIPLDAEDLPLIVHVVSGAARLV